MTQARAHAKINLYLHVTGRRPDGYHELDSLAVFASSHDLLKVVVDDESCKTSGRVNLKLDGPFGQALFGQDDNLVTRAATCLRSRAACTPLPSLSITLTKNLPVASGIGGGSSDAAAALRVIASSWGVDVQELPAIAAKLGADVPVCLSHRPARMRGTGDDLAPAPILPPVYLLLVNPGVAVPTPDVFKALRTGPAKFSAPARLPKKWDDFDAMVRALEETSNDLQEAAQQICPKITEVLAFMALQNGCHFSRMSGSGATCFGLFSEARLALTAADICRQHGWWADAGPMLR